MTILPKAKKLWQIASGKELREEAKNKDEWDDLDSVASMYITQGVDKNHILVLNYETSAQMW
jgi:DUF2075 family protein